jgi:hypothetical protein
MNFLIFLFALVTVLGTIREVRAFIKKPKSYAVCWVERHQHGFLEPEMIDRYETFIHDEWPDAKQAAEKRYEEIRMMDNTWTANVCEIIKSTES